MIKPFNKKGFTLIEILIAVGIVVFLSTMVFVSHKKGEGQLALQRAAHKLTQDIRRTAEMAMSAREFGGSIPSGGYGLCLKVSWLTYYKIYGDTNNNEKCEPADTEIEVINLEKGVYIQDFFYNSLDIVFKPPAPDIVIRAVPTETLSEATIILALQSDPSQQKTIKINTAGLVETE